MADSTATLRALFEKIAKENKISNYDVKIKSISSGGANYTSQLYLTTISNDSKELKLFAKAIIMGDKIRQQGFDNMFDREPFVYTELAKIYRRLEEKHNVPRENRFEFPKFYGHDSTRGEEALVLEDLSTQGYSVYDRFKSVEWDYAFKAIKELAKLHALSFAFEQEHPDEFDKVQKTFTNLMANNEQLKPLLEDSLKMTLSIAEGENRRRLEDFVKKSDIMLDFIKYQKPLRRSVLIHSDFRVSNQMYKVDEEGNYHIKILDYQTMTAASPVNDLLYFIFTGTDEAFRAKHYLPLIDHYYSQLSMAMRSLGLKPNEIYSREDFDTELKEKLPFGLIIATCFLPIVLVEEEDAPIMDKDKDITELRVTKIGKQYPERLNGALNDYVRWKVI